MLLFLIVFAYRCTFYKSLEKKSIIILIFFEFFREPILDAHGDIFLRIPCPNRELCTVDRVHPNDLGFAKMASIVEPVIKAVLEKDAEIAKEFNH